MSTPSFHGREESARNLAGIWNPLEDDYFDRDSDLAPPDGESKPEPAPPKPTIFEAHKSMPPASFDPFRDVDEPAHFFTLDPGDLSRADRIDSLLSLNLPATHAMPRLDPSKIVQPPAPPKSGDTVCGFLLLSILGRGAFATVYLAEQIDLGRRLVALKVSKAEGEEPRILAKLQHTHIVPIYSVNDDSATGLRLLCMPYLGGANLAQVLEAAEDRVPSRGESYKSLVAALDEVSQRFLSAQGPVRSVLMEHESRLKSGLKSGRASKSLPAAPVDRDESVSAAPKLSVSGSARSSIWRWPTLLGEISQRVRSVSASSTVHEADFDQPARLFLREANTVQAAVWVIARLAEGLEHAHSRGMLHRDLKPSNILIARDGTPMLLDFNLSTDMHVDDAVEGEKAMLGGTLPYMSPEHLDAFNPKGKSTAESVTERSDIYAMGLILHEMLAGEHPFPEPPARLPLLETLNHLWEQRQHVPSIRKARAEVPWSIDAVLKKCLDPDPSKRYASARELSEDLSRYLDDLPLKHTPEPSLRERWGKWKRRNPRLCGSGSIGIFAGLGFVLFGVLIAFLSSNMQALAARVKYQKFNDNFIECRFLLNLQSGPAEHLGRGAALADKTLESEEIGAAGDFKPTSWINRLTLAEQKQVREQTSELMLLQARSKIDLAQRSGSDVERLRAVEQGIRLLEGAQKIDPRPPAALFADLARYHNAIGRADLAAIDRAKEASQQPSTLRDFQLLGSSLLARNQIPKAMAALQRAIDIDPKAYWAWFTLGHCHFEQARYLEAAGDFAACIALEPRFPWSYLNRGLALARSGRLSEAKDCYLKAIGHNPRFAEAWINLALADLELNDLTDAERAAEKARSLGRKESSLLAILGEIKARMGKADEAESLYRSILSRNPSDLNVLNARGIFRIKTNPQAAVEDFQKVIQLDPANSRAHFGMALMNRKTDPESALKDVEIALNSDPNFLDALQLRALTKARLGIVSAIDDAEKLARIETANRLYNAACALALLSEKVPDAATSERALDFLERAVELGFDPRAAASDSDLKAVATFSRFQKIVSRSRSQAQG